MSMTHAGTRLTSAECWPRPQASPLLLECPYNMAAGFPQNGRNLTVSCDLTLGGISIMSDGYKVVETTQPYRWHRAGTIGRSPQTLTANALHPGLSSCPGVLSRRPPQQMQTLRAHALLVSSPSLCAASLIQRVNYRQCVQSMLQEEYYSSPHSPSGNRRAKVSTKR